jgi:hypothetical protein
MHAFISQFAARRARQEFMPRAAFSLASLKLLAIT